MTPVLDATDRGLLNAVQAGIDLAPRPFRAIGERLGVAEDEVIRRLSEWKRTGVIRQISAIFDTRKLGYRSMLVAARIPEDRLLAGVRQVNTHPGVSHNYERRHAWNVWYTIAVPPEGSIDEDNATLARRASIEACRSLPTLRLYKIGMKLDVGETGADLRKEDGPIYNEAIRARTEAREIDGTDRRIVRALQEDFPLAPDTYARMAAAAGTDEGTLLERARTLQAEGRLRRIAAVLRHRKAGFAANGMVVWKVPEGEVDAVGERFAGFRIVSHCYRRPTYPDWPYSLFTMVHGPSEEACRTIAQRMSEESGVNEYEILFSTREFKKVRVRYFTEDYALWREGRLAEAAAEIIDETAEG